MGDRIDGKTMQGFARTLAGRSCCVLAAMALLGGQAALAQDSAGASAAAETAAETAPAADAAPADGGASPEPAPAADAAEAGETASAGDSAVAVSRWGEDDQLGAANLMTAERILQAADLVTEGKVYSLGIVVGPDTPAFPPRSLSLTVLQPGQNGNSGLGANAFTYNDDIFMGWLGIGPQIDGLGHSGEDHVYYGGRRYDDFAPASGLTELGLDKLPGLVGRGVLLDMAKHFGTDMVEEGVPYTEEDIRAAAEAQGVELREGDVVLFHSNWMELLDGASPDPERFGAAEPGLGVSGAEYLAEIGVMAVGADTWGMEVVPAETEGEAFRAHQVLQTHNGIYILENMDTRELAADGVNEFLFVLGQARLQGAVQMIINPIAIR